jgi:hypothetical protein
LPVSEPKPPAWHRIPRLPHLARSTSNHRTLFDFFDIRETTKKVIKHAGHLFIAHDEDHRNRANHVAAE